MRDTVFTKVDYDLASFVKYIELGEIERHYIRTGPSTTGLSASQIQEYIRRRFGV